jgi:hypothetical protein
MVRQGSCVLRLTSCPLQRECRSKTRPFGQLNINQIHSKSKKCARAKVGTASVTLALKEEKPGGMR